MPAAQIGDLTIEYDIAGEGDPLLLVMGLGGQLVRWPDRFVGLLADEGFRVIRFDNRDVGLSTMTPGPPPNIARLAAAFVRGARTDAPYRIADMARDAAGLLRELGVGAAHVVGVSMGGMIAQQLAIDHPDRVASLTSIMSNTGDRRHGGVSRRLARRLPRLFDRGAEVTEERLVEASRFIAGAHFDEPLERDLARRALARSRDPRGTAHQLQAILASPDRTAGLRGVTAPTLVIHGLMDPLVRPSGGMATASAVPGSRLLMFPDMGHDLPVPRWPEIVAAITANAHRATPTPTRTPTSTPTRRPL